MAAVSKVDYVFGSDVFYDPAVFETLVALLRKLFDSFPDLEVYIAYQIRDSDWSIEEFLSVSGLCCSIIRCVDTEQHSICLVKISINGSSMMRGKRIVFAGVEGGATHSSLVLIDSAGSKIGEYNNGPGLNCLLNGVEKTADEIVRWIRSSVIIGIEDNAEITFPISSLGMGLSGAEDEDTNRRMLEYMKVQHGDIANHIFLTSDSIAAAATSFDKDGVVLIAGTGSACRLLKANGDVHGVGGWGHLIGDGGGGFWIVMRAVKRIFDAEDGFLCQPDESFESDITWIMPVKKALLSHFNIDSKLSLLDLLYNPQFKKSFIASFCEKISELAHAGDKFATDLFCDAGEALADHLISVSRYFDEEMFCAVPIVLIGSVFKSWTFMKKGFENRVKRANEGIKKPERRFQSLLMYKVGSSSAVGAAFLGAKFTLNWNDELFKKLQSRTQIDHLDFNYQKSDNKTKRI